jgi:hypothetical protein
LILSDVAHWPKFLLHKPKRSYKSDRQQKKISADFSRFSWKSSDKLGAFHGFFANGPNFASDLTNVGPI